MCDDLKSMLAWRERYELTDPLQTNYLQDPRDEVVDEDDHDDDKTIEGVERDVERALKDGPTDQAMMKAVEGIAFKIVYDNIICNTEYAWFTYRRERLVLDLDAPQNREMIPYWHNQKKCLRPRVEMSLPYKSDMFGELKSVARLNHMKISDSDQDELRPLGSVISWGWWSDGEKKKKAKQRGGDRFMPPPPVQILNPEQLLIAREERIALNDNLAPQHIALDLTLDKIPSPSGAADWTFQTINKILDNQIYIGVYVRNKIRRVRNYNTGKRDAHKASPDELVTADFPLLRIIPQELWDAAQAVRRERSNKIFGGKQIERSTVVRKLHPFTGLFRCAECGSKMIIAGSGRNGDRAIACSEAWWRSSTCKHRKSYSLARLTAHSIDKMHEHLTDPEFVKERASERAKMLASLEREATGERATTQRELDRVDLRIKKLIRLTEDDDSDDVPQEARERMKELRAEKRGLEQRLMMLDSKITGAVPHPNAVKALARDVDTLHNMLRDNPDDPACRMALGNLIERALVHPTGHNQPYDVSLFARHAAYVGELPLFPEYKARNSMENQSVARINTVKAIVPS